MTKDKKMTNEQMNNLMLKNIEKIFDNQDEMNNKFSAQEVLVAKIDVKVEHIQEGIDTLNNKHEKNERKIKTNSDKIATIDKKIEGNDSSKKTIIFIWIQFIALIGAIVSIIALLIK